MSKGKAGEFDTKVGATIAEVRKEKGLLQKDLAKKIGLSWQQLHKYERGENRVTVAVFCRVAEAIGVSPVTLMKAVMAASSEA